MRFILLTLFSLIFVNAGGGVLDVDWSGINRVQQKVSAPYPKVLVEGVKKVRLPVYLSSSYAYDKNMVVVSDKDFYTISIFLKGAMVLFEGDRTYQESVSPANKEFQKIVQKATPVEFFKSEELMVASFNKHGANYMISIECDNPKRDKRCKEETFIRDLYSRIIVVGGRP